MAEAADSFEAPSGALMCMPLLILSMGGEMIYILEQRLEAQKIQEMKGQIEVLMRPKRALKKNMLN